MQFEITTDEHATQSNSGIILYKFELNFDTTEATQTFGGATVDHNTVNWWFKKFCSIYKKLDNKVRSCKPKTIDSEAVL